MKKIGLSLSFCVKDILSGKVNREDVKMIISGTKAATTEEVRQLIEDYRKSYWSAYEEDSVISLIRWLMENHIIIQSRIILKGECPNIGSGHWVSSMNDIKWEDR